MQTMVELTVVFDNPSIDNYVLLTEQTASLDDEVGALKAEARSKIPNLKDEQCFFRMFSRE